MTNLYSTSFQTPIGDMMAVANDSALLLLEFVERKNLAAELKKFGTAMIEKTNDILQQIQEELALYFAGKLTDFFTPLYLQGTDFQKTVWQELMNIACGETRSYAALAESINKPSAFRAVALANSMNQLAIIVPCHRVINSDGKLGGYAGGVDRKAWLLEHESRFV
jgi:O-6-methylguanine DNA methyltransferase